MVRFPKAYIMNIDEQVKAMAIKDISTFGADEFVTKACVRLDCSRVINDMRMMQTIGTPYQYEVGRTLYGISYALEQGWIDENKRDEYVSKLVALHKRNLKYEEDSKDVFLFPLFYHLTDPISINFLAYPYYPHIVPKLPWPAAFYPHQCRNN